MVVRLIAIGGGGFTHEADPGMEDFILAQAAVARPRIGFIGAASGDDALKIQRFYARFAAVANICSHLPLQASAAEAARWLDELDIVYVGGGHTLKLIEHWRHSGHDQVLIHAARHGVLMAGVSAGASAWFESALSDASGKGLAPIPGIGMVPGSCCPHYSSEPMRRPAFEANIGRGDLPDGIAIDDGAAVLMEEGRCLGVFPARAGAQAHLVRQVEGRVLAQPIKALSLP